jgi:hypothetical protein
MLRIIFLTARKIFLIGGSHKFGSGKVVSKFVSYLEHNQIDFELIETQGARLSFVARLIQLPKKSLVIYQPSVCFPAFFRDIIIVSFLYLRSSRLHFLLLVDLRFKNIFFNKEFLRSLFFRNHPVFGLATPSVSLRNFIKIPIYFENTKLQKNIINYGNTSYTLVHFGYRSRIKGWSNFYKTASKFHRTTSFHYIGRDDLKTYENRFIQSYKSKSNLDIENTLKTVFDHETPIYLFSSREDFAPLMVLECGWWGVPIICIKDTKAEKILSRFISKTYFLSVDPEQISNINLQDAEQAALQFSNFLNSYHEDSFCSDITTQILQSKI